MNLNLGPKDKDQILRVGTISAAVLAVVGYGYYELRTPDAPPPAAAPVIVSAPARATPSANPAGNPAGAVPRAATGQSASAANKVATTAAQYDPTLKMEPMLVTESLIYSGSGRNIFSTTSAPVNVPIPVPKAPVRTTGVVLPVYQPPSGPPPLPPIDLKFFGTATRSDGTRQAFLLHGEDVFLASTGSIVQRRYKVGTVSSSSVEVEDLTNNNKQTLQLQKN